MFQLIQEVLSNWSSFGSTEKTLFIVSLPSFVLCMVTLMRSLHLTPSSLVKLLRIFSAKLKTHTLRVQEQKQQQQNLAQEQHRQELLAELASLKEDELNELKSISLRDPSRRS